MRPPLELRNEAIAVLAITDLGPPQFGSDTPWTNTHPQELSTAFDAAVRRVALMAQDSSTHVRRVADDTQLLRLPPLGIDAAYPAKLQFSPDDSLLAVTGQESLHLWALRELGWELAALNLDWNQP